MIPRRFLMCPWILDRTVSWSDVSKFEYVDAVKGVCVAILRVPHNSPNRRKGLLSRRTVYQSSEIGKILFDE